MRFSLFGSKRSRRFRAGQILATGRAGGVILRHPGSLLIASHQALRRAAMREKLRREFRQNLCQKLCQNLGLIAGMLALGASCAAQQPNGPQSGAPPAVAPAPRPAAAQADSGERILVPSGTRVGVVLQNGISTRSAKAGDSVYLQTSFPITSNNRIVIPVGSYLRGELLEAKRPGRIKGRGEFRMRLDTLILPNGYTVDLRAAPRSADSGGKETMDSEGKV